MENQDPNQQPAPPADPNAAAPQPSAPAAPEPTATAAPKPPTGGPTQPSLDEDKLDSLGEPKEGGLIGPRGANVSPEHLTEIQKKESADATEKRLQQGMSSTDGVDSIGNPKGHFETVEQGNDRHGARIPDEVLRDEEPIEPHQPMVGPRGTGAPKDSYHK